MLVSTDGSPTLAFNPLESKRLALTEQEAKQQELVAQLHRETDTKFMQQYTELAQQQKEFDRRLKALEPEIQLQEGLPRTVTVIILIVLAVAGFGFTWILYRAINYRSDLRSDAISILGPALTITGLLYLAYDLLGRQQGPLRWLTLFATGGLAGITILEPIALYEVFQSSVPTALQVELTGALLGAFSALLFGVQDRGTNRQRFSLKGCLLGVVAAAAFWAMILGLFTRNNNLITILILLIIAAILAIPTGGMLGGFQKSFFYETLTSKSRPSFFSWKSSLKGLGIGLIVWGILLSSVYLFTPHGDSHSLVVNLIIILILASAGAASGGIARFTFWWVNHLPERVLGAFGLVLAFIGAIVPVVQPLLNLLKAIGIL